MSSSVLPLSPRRAGPARAWLMAALAFLSSSPAWSAEEEESAQANPVEELDQRIRVLERLREVDAEAAQRGWPAMHAQLAHIDPQTANRLAPNDAQRIQRAIEVFRTSGRPLSSFHTRRTRPKDTPPLLSLEPVDRAWLHERIAQRFDAMLDAGFLEEVRALRTRADLSCDLPSMRCVGYRQAWAALDADDLSTLRETAIAATRHFSECMLYGRHADEVLGGEGHFHDDHELCRIYWKGPALSDEGFRDFVAAMTSRQVAIGVQSFIGTDIGRIRRLLAA